MGFYLTLFLGGILGLVAASVSLSTQNGYIAMTATVGGSGIVAAIAAVAQRVAQTNVAMGAPMGLLGDGVAVAGELLLIWGVFRFQSHVGEWSGCERSFTRRRCIICTCSARSEGSTSREGSRGRSVVGKGRRKRRSGYEEGY